MRSHSGSIMIFLLLVASWAGEVDAQVVKRQPYLQVLTATSVVVRWDTDSSIAGKVYYGASATSLGDSASETASRSKHEVTLAGLTPRQKYYFSVTGPSGGGENQYVITAPPPGSPQSTRIWVVSDFGQSNTASNNTRRLQTIDVWKQFNNSDLRADFMLSLGDQSEDDTEAQLKENYFDQLQDVLKVTPLFTIAGNHEDHDGQVSYKAAFTLPTNGEAGGFPSGTEDYYSFDYGNIHVVGLTVEGGVSISGAQTRWLQDDLAHNKSDWLIAFMHRPMHSAGYHPTDGSSTALEQKANWLPLLEAAGVDLILAGHNHVYERSYLVDNLVGNSTDMTGTNKIDTALGRADVGGAYNKVPGQPHAGTIFITCEAGGTSNKASYLPVPYKFDPVVFASDLYEGSLVIDVSGKDHMDVKFLCDEVNLQGSHIWDYFTIVKSGGPNSVAGQTVGIPETFSVSNYPNPFNPATTIHYTIAGAGGSGLGTRKTMLVVYDMLGRQVATLVDEVKAPGSYEVRFDGAGLASGMYISRLTAGSFVQSRAMLLLR